MNKNVLTEFLQRQNEFLQGRLDETPVCRMAAKHPDRKIPRPAP